MIARRLFATFIMALGAVGCSSLDVHSDFNESFDFSTYQSFGFISDKPLLFAETAPVNPLFEGRLLRATRDALESKGYRFVDDREQADFVVSFTIGARDKIKVTSYPTTYRGYSRRLGWGGAYYNEVDVRNYTEGTLAIDLFDVQQRSPVWHGWAVKTISARDRSNPTQAINEAVTAILADFPPQ